MPASYTIQELRDVCLFPSHGVQEFPTQDMDEVHPGVFLGNAASAADLDRLRTRNIRSVLNAAHGLDSELNLVEVHPGDVYEGAGIAFLGVGALDMASYPLRVHFAESTRFIREGLRSGGAVLLHCRQGISRSAALVIAYLVEAERMDVKEATRVIRGRREILPNDGFLQQLAEFQMECR